MAAEGLCSSLSSAGRTLTAKKRAGTFYMHRLVFYLYALLYIFIFLSLKISVSVKELIDFTRSFAALSYGPYDE